MEIKRDKYLNELINKMHNKQIKVITGIRRCGKSYFLNNIFYRYLIEKGINKENIIIIISLDEIQNRWLLDANKLYEFIKSKIIDNNMYYVIIDEIQEVKDFIYVLNSLIKT